jgi:hypothetical protein
MSKCESHNWSDWTPWFFYGSGLDIRERFCRNDECVNGSDYEQRPHEHAYAPVPDPFSPVGTGLTLQVCTICHDVKS